MDAHTQLRQLASTSDGMVVFSPVTRVTRVRSPEATPICWSIICQVHLHGRANINIKFQIF